MLEKAIQIAIEAHKGQTDKAGQPYILHCLRVMLAGKTTEEMICGVLHDVVEDTPYTLNDLKNIGFSQTVISALDCVTIRKGETYSDFIIRSSENKLAKTIKINDLTDNLDVKRLSVISEKDISRINKYKKALDYLTSKRLTVNKI